MLVLLKPQKAKFCHRCFQPLSGQSFLRADTAECPGSPWKRCLPVPAALGTSGCGWQGTLLTVTHGGGGH